MNNDLTFKSTTNSNDWTTCNYNCNTTEFMLEDIMTELKYIQKQLDEIKDVIKTDKCKCTCECNAIPSNINKEIPVEKFKNIDNSITKPETNKTTITCNNVNELSDMIESLFGSDIANDINISFFN